MKKYQSDNVLVMGRIYQNYQGLGFIIKDIVNSKEITVEFLEPYGYSTVTQKAKILIGKVKNPFFPSVSGVGYMGELYYINKSKCRSYRVWRQMLDRCYNPENHAAERYKNCFVCEEWKNFTNFYNWYESRSRENWELDKDIIRIFPHRG